MLKFELYKLNCVVRNIPTERRKDKYTTKHRNHLRHTKTVKSTEIKRKAVFFQCASSGDLINKQTKQTDRQTNKQTKQTVKQTNNTNN